MKKLIKRRFAFLVLALAVSALRVRAVSRKEEDGAKRAIEVHLYRSGKKKPDGSFGQGSGEELKFLLYESPIEPWKNHIWVLGFLYEILKLDPKIAEERLRFFYYNEVLKDDDPNKRYTPFSDLPPSYIKNFKGRIRLDILLEKEKDGLVERKFQDYVDHVKKLTSSPGSTIIRPPNISGSGDSVGAQKKTVQHKKGRCWKTVALGTAIACLVALTVSALLYRSLHEEVTTKKKRREAEEEEEEKEKKEKEEEEPLTAPPSGSNGSRPYCGGAP